MCWVRWIVCLMPFFGLFVKTWGITTQRAVVGTEKYLTNWSSFAVKIKIEIPRRGGNLKGFSFLDQVIKFPHWHGLTVALSGDQKQKHWSAYIISPKSKRKERKAKEKQKKSKRKAKEKQKTNKRKEKEKQKKSKKAKALVCLYNSCHFHCLVSKFGQTLFSEVFCRSYQRDVFCVFCGATK